MKPLFLLRLKTSSFYLLLETVRIVLLPVPAVTAHVLNTELRFPAEFCLCLCGVTVACSDVTRAAWLDSIWNGNTVSLLECLNNVEH